MLQKMMLLFAICLMLSATTVNAKTYSYPGENSVFSITFPDDWNVEPEDEILHAGPKDGTIYLGTWALQDANNIEDALEALDSNLEKYFSELSFEDPEELEINEIPFLAIDGEGKDQEGNNVVVSVALFSPDEETIFIMMYFGSPEAGEAYEEELVEIIGSIQPE